METLTEKVRDFLAVKTGWGYGSGDGWGDGSGYGWGYGSGDGWGDGSGYGWGYGSGDGWGDGSGDGSGYGSGDGWGDGSGDGVKSVNGETVYLVDGVQTVIRQVSHGFARGAILNSDLTLTPCYIAKSGNKFAHGETLKKAVAALQDKLFEDMPEDERIAAFIEAHPDKNAKVPARDLWVWHNRLTRSCEMGRNQFASDRGINIDEDSFTPEEFCAMCRNSYGGTTIKKLEEMYNEEEQK